VPERFLPRLEETGFVSTAEFEFIPFSAGRRACLGLPLATRMLHAMLGSLLLRFDWSLQPEAMENGVDMSESLGLTMTMTTPLKAIAKPWSV
jgi:cytochrome P450